MDATHLRSMTPGASALALLCALLWGANATAAQFTQDDLPPLGTAWIRFAISVPFLALWFRRQGSTFAPRRDEWPAIALVGVFVFAQIGTFHYGLGHTNAAHASLIIGMNPVVVALLANFFLRGERLNGLMAASGGLGLIVFTAAPGGRDEVTTAGDLILTGSLLLLGLKVVVSKRVLRRIDPGRLLVWSHAIGSVLLLAASGFMEGFHSYRMTARAIGGLTFMGIAVAFFCFAAWTVLLRRHAASQLQAFAFGQPVFGVMFGILLRDDPVTLPLAAGAAAITLGIALVTWGGNRRASLDAPA